ncbi:MAG: hypothetical protein HYU97_06395 [Deltaproteobacteria bacterium]|nr:hypothetical protein [Deltaproteobacteria bacterium]
MLVSNLQAPSSKSITLLSLSSLEDLPERLKLASPHFACLLACDAQELEDTQINELADFLLQQGLAYLGVWGPECERVRDLFAVKVSELEIAEGVEFPLLTHCHKEKELEEVLGSFVQSAKPDDAYVKTCQSLLIVCVNKPEWETTFKQTLAAKGLQTKP